jgi:RNA polymerase sigma factor (sigma-70 family)
MATMDNTKYVESVVEIELNWNTQFVSQSKKYWDAMFRFSFSLCNNKIKAEDIHQTSLLKSLKAFQKFVINYNAQANSNEEVDSLFQSPDIQYHFKNWLFRIVKNTYIDDREVNKKWKFDSSEEALNTLYNEPSDPLQNDFSNNINDLKKSEKEFYRLALDDNWKKRLDQLNDRQRSILFLAAEDYSYKDISAILGIPIGTVMSTLSRTLQKLKSN